MKIGFIGQDEELCQQLRQYGQIEAIIQLDKEQADQTSVLTDCSVVLLSDRQIDLFELDGLTARFPDRAKLVYLMSYRNSLESTKEAELVCKRLGIGFIPPKRTAEQIAIELLKRFDSGFSTPEKGGQIITFYGAIAQAGLTATVLSFAQELSQTVEAKIGVLSLNAYTPGDHFAPYKTSYLNDLYTQIKDTKVLTSAELANQMQPVEDFHYLAGNTDLTKRYRFSSESAQHLISCARQQFDIVLIDAGANSDNNLCIQSLLHADMRVVVTTQQPSALDMWHRASDLMKRISGFEKGLPFMLLLNKYNKLLGDMKAFEQQMAVPLLGWLPDLKEEALLCEAERRLLTTIDDAKYRDQLREMGLLLHERFEWPLQQGEADRKRGLWRWRIR